MFVSSFLPAFAEVSQMQLDSELYFLNDSIYLDGTVTNDSSGLVTIVLRDPDNKFVLMSQAIIESDNTFEKIIPIDERFRIPGTYNATSFVLNMTDAKVQSFDILFSNFHDNGIKPDIYQENFQEPTLEEEKIYENKADSKFKIDELLYENTNPFIDNKPKIADFVDPLKKPQYYLDRYYNEPVYKSWFDRNYPDLTIEEAVGYTISKNVKIEERIPENQIIPAAEASLIASTYQTEDNKDIALSVLAIAGLGILFAAVYGIKRKSENKSKLSLLKKTQLGNFFPKIPNRDPSRIIQVRLAKGEISIEEFERLKERLDKNS